MEKTRNAGHHRFHPFRFALGAHAIFNDRIQKGMPRSGAKSVVADFPIHLIFAAQISVQSQFFEREHATVPKQFTHSLCKENISIEIKTAQPKHRQVTEEIVLLNRITKGVEDASILRELLFDEGNHLRIIKKQIFKAFVKGPKTRDRR